MPDPIKSSAADVPPIDSTGMITEPMLPDPLLATAIFSPPAKKTSANGRVPLTPVERDMAGELINSAGAAKWDRLSVILKALERLDQPTATEIVNRRNKTEQAPPILLMVKNGAPHQLVQKILDLGARVTVADVNGQTPMGALENRGGKDLNYDRTWMLLHKNSFASSVPAVSKPVAPKAPEIKALEIKIPQQVEKTTPITGKASAIEFGESLARKIILAHPFPNSMRILRETIQKIEVFWKGISNEILEFALAKGRTETKNALNTVHESIGCNVLHAICLASAPEQVVKLVLGYGVDPNLKTQANSESLSSVLIGNLGLVNIDSVLYQDGALQTQMPVGLTALHLASLRLRPETAELLIAAGADVLTTTPAGENAIALTLKEFTRNFLFSTFSAEGFNSKRFRTLLGVLFKAGVDINQKTSSNSSLLALALQSGEFETVKEFLKLGSDGLVVTKENPEGTLIGFDGVRRQLSLSSIEDFIVLLKNSKIDEQIAICHFLVKSASFILAAKLAQAFKDGKSLTPVKNSSGFTEILPTLLKVSWGIEHRQLSRMIHNNHIVARLFGTNFHPNESDLLMLLTHPAARETDDGADSEISYMLPNAFNDLTDSLTSIDRWMSSWRRLPGDISNIWARFGQDSYSFNVQKYTARRFAQTNIMNFKQTLELPSLMEQFGWRAIVGRRSDYKLDAQGQKVLFHNPGFALLPGTVNFPVVTEGFDGHRSVRKSSAEVLYIYNRAFKIISHPAGTIVIPNKSPHFGRDVLQHSGYVSRKGLGNGFSQQELLRLDLEILSKHFLPILSAQAFKDPTMIKTVQFLQEENLALEDAMDGWLFETRREMAWADMGPQFGESLVGGFYSTGFALLLDHYEDLYKRKASDPKIVIPDLAFRARYKPSFGHYYEYQHPTLGTRRTLAVTPEVLSALKDYLAGTATDKQLIRHGIRAFFQEAGFSTQGALTLVDPE